eukprot:TRINITY_DN12366_c0_g1_i2.p1 TRINITY_DN12366_c0_g1~~TRINITY_DN12366_c0_g1_i2.p1  ORF type:complete len:219 (+),score=52.73 TRINITY_DN12366_c0_g1_i2:117-773(+)
MCIRDSRNPSTAAALQQLIESNSNRTFAHVLGLDVADEASVEVLPQALKELGVSKVDCLIHNAGVSAPTHPVDPFASASKQAMIGCFATNAVGPLLVTQALLPLLRESEVRKVFFVSTVMASMAATTSGGAVCYRTTKAAENMVARCLAGEHGQGTEDRLLVTLCHPGWCDTDMGGAGGREPPVQPEESVAGMLAVVDGMGEHSRADFVDYTGRPLQW